MALHGAVHRGLLQGEAGLTIWTTKFVGRPQPDSIQIQCFRTLDTPNSSHIMQRPMPLSALKCPKALLTPLLQHFVHYGWQGIVYKICKPPCTSMANRMCSSCVLRTEEAPSRSRSPMLSQQLTCHVCARQQPQVVVHLHVIGHGIVGWAQIIRPQPLQVQG